MFGYIRPLKGELKVREYEQFKTCYCALCHTLKSDYGAYARLILNYDFTFLAMLLWDGNDKPKTACSRCVASPLVEKTYCTKIDALETCAGYSVILAFWKLRDAVSDEPFIKSLRDRIGLLLLRKAYKKSAMRYPDYVQTVKLNIEALSSLEKSDSSSLDACADKFALITAALAYEEKYSEESRPLEQLLYHTGRLVYILDACDDLDEDWQAGRFNPVVKRFNLLSSTLSDEAMESLQTTLSHSVNMVGASYELLTENYWSPITRNIVYLGMPDACARVLSGTWRQKRNQNKKKEMSQL